MPRDGAAAARRSGAAVKKEQQHSAAEGPRKRSTKNPRTEIIASLEGLRLNTQAQLSELVTEHEVRSHLSPAARSCLSLHSSTCMMHSLSPTTIEPTHTHACIHTMHRACHPTEAARAP
jgi:hypothetical protein